MTTTHPQSTTITTKTTHPSKPTTTTSTSPSHIGKKIKHNPPFSDMKNKTVTTPSQIIQQIKIHDTRSILFLKKKAQEIKKYNDCPISDYKTCEVEDDPHKAIWPDDIKGGTKNI